MSTIHRQTGFPSIVRWVLVLGASGFAAGFFGPLIFSPEANQGPLVGILITGPGGVFLGALFYALSRLLRISATGQWRAIWVSSAALALVTLCFVMPKPELRGSIVDIQVQKCEPTVQAVDAAIGYWKKRVAAVTWAAPRPGWEEDARLKLQYDSGVVLDVVVARKNSIFEERKPWNKGRMIATGWPSAEPRQKSYYASYAGGSCADYPIGSRFMQFTPYDLSGLTRDAEDWPPRKPADFLDRQTLEPVPGEFRKLIGE